MWRKSHFKAMIDGDYVMFYSNDLNRSYMNLAVAKYIKSAQEKIELEQWQEAKINLEQAITIEPSRWDIHFNLGVILSKQQQYQEAANKFQEAIAIKPDYDWSYNNLGQAFLKSGRVSDAIQSFIQAVTINQNNPHFYYNLGEALVKKNSVERAIDCFRQAAELDREDYELQFKLGKSFQNQGLIVESIACFCQALELNPECTSAYIALRYIKLEPRQCDRLIYFYQQILIDSPNQPEALANLSDLLAQRGNLPDAITFSRQAIKIKTILENPPLAQAKWQFRQKAPDFIIIGTGKSGTTSLYKYLGDHPQILLPNKKELRFFDRNFDYGYQWYLAQFPSIGDRADLLTGEASPSYFFLPHAAQRIHDFAPQTKLIIMLRNPVERSISDYYQNLKAGNQHLTLEEAIDKQIKNLGQQSEAELAYGGGILSQSLYFYKLRRWMKIFPKNQFLIVNSDLFFANPSKLMEQVFSFLDLPNIQNSRYQRYNTSSYPQVEDQIKQKLNNFFTPHNKRLEEYLQTNFNW